MKVENCNWSFMQSQICLLPEFTSLKDKHIMFHYVQTPEMARKKLMKFPLFAGCFVDHILHSVGGTGNVL